MSPLRAQFSGNFEFGTATSAYQIEGHSFGGAGRCHWDDFADVSGNVERGENGATACDHYHRFEDDLDLVAKCGFDSYRFSTSWSRILPEGSGQVNEAGLDYYERLVDAMLERDFKPYLTLYHWELPSALNDLGGWRNPEIAHWFADYCEVVIRRLGDRVFRSATLNEPWCVSFLSHFIGAHAPGLRDIRATARAMHHVMLAHGRATQRLRDLGQDNLGCVFNLEYAQPVDESKEARYAAEVYDAIYNKFFLSSVFHKSYPEIILPALEPHLPKGWQDDFEDIATPIDWVGINYYTRKIIAPAEGAWPHLKHVPGLLPKTDLDWEIYPEGLSALLMRVARDYTGDLPLFVTENGMANADQCVGDVVHDPERVSYFEKHLAQVQQAIERGAPVQGYFAWSLLDNYEWAFGYDKRFGLVHVDFETQKRTPKSSYYWFKERLTDSSLSNPSDG